MDGLETKRPQRQGKGEHWPSIAQPLGTLLLSACFSITHTSQYFGGGTETRIMIDN